MAFGYLDALTMAASLAAGVATANPAVTIGTQAALSGGKTALQGGSAQQIATSAAMSGAMGAAGAGAGAIGGEIGGEVGQQVAPIAMNAGIGALRGKSAQEIAEEAALSGAKSGVSGGIHDLMDDTTVSGRARGGPVNPALLYAMGGLVRRRRHFDDGGDINAGDSRGSDVGDRAGGAAATGMDSSGDRGDGGGAIGIEGGISTDTSNASFGGKSGVETSSLGTDALDADPGGLEKAAYGIDPTAGDLYDARASDVGSRAGSPSTGVEPGFFGGDANYGKEQGTDGNRGSEGNNNYNPGDMNNAPPPSAPPTPPGQVPTTPPPLTVHMPTVSDLVRPGTINPDKSSFGYTTPRYLAGGGRVGFASDGGVGGDWSDDSVWTDVNENPSMSSYSPQFEATNTYSTTPTYLDPYSSAGSDVGTLAAAPPPQVDTTTPKPVATNTTRAVSARGSLSVPPPRTEAVPVVPPKPADTTPAAKSDGKGDAKDKKEDPDWFDRNKKWAIPAGIGGLLGVGMLGSMIRTGGKKSAAKSKAQLYAENPENMPRPSTIVAPPAGYRPGFDPEWSYIRYADGGRVGFQDGSDVSDSLSEYYPAVDDDADTAYRRRVGQLAPYLSMAERPPVPGPDYGQSRMRPQRTYEERLPDAARLSRVNPASGMTTDSRPRYSFPQMGDPDEPYPVPGRSYAAFQERLPDAERLSRVNPGVMPYSPYRPDRPPGRLDYVGAYDFEPRPVQGRSYSSPEDRLYDRLLAASNTRPTDRPATQSYTSPEERAYDRDLARSNTRPTDRPAVWNYTSSEDRYYTPRVPMEGGPRSQTGTRSYDSQEDRPRTRRPPPTFGQVGEDNYEGIPRPQEDRDTRATAADRPPADRELIRMRAVAPGVNRALEDRTTPVTADQPVTDRELARMRAVPSGTVRPAPDQVAPRPKQQAKPQRRAPRPPVARQQSLTTDELNNLSLMLSRARGQPAERQTESALGRAPAALRTYYGLAKGGGIGELAAGRNVGQMGSYERGIDGRRVMNDAEQALSNNHPDPESAISRFRQYYGDDALKTLMEKARKGDGLSDSIPATIDRSKEAALSSGEYVIPADVVSHLGNGSSNAGTRELDMMLARVRKGRTGSPQQARGINPMSAMPR